METSQLHEICQADATDRMAVLIQQQAQFLAFLHRRLGNDADTEDVRQTAYLKALTAVETMREEEKTERSPQPCTIPSAIRPDTRTA